MPLLTIQIIVCNINTIVNTVTGYARLNITLPKELADYVRSSTANISRYIADAVNERMAREKQESAMKAILSGPPTFTNIDDSAAYIRGLREEDKKRDKRLGLL